MLSQGTEASRAKDQRVNSPWHTLERSHPLMNPHLQTPSITLGEAGVFMTQERGAQAQTHS